VQRTLLGGLRHGLATALGALLADAFYGSIAAFGLAQVAAPAGWLRHALAVLAAALLTFLGVKYLRRAWRGAVAPEPPQSKDSRFGGLLGLLVSTFVLTLATPGTLPAFVLMFAGLDLAARSHEVTAGPYLVVAGVVIGAGLWWLLLCGVVHHFRARAQNWLRGMEFACGALLLVGAAAAIWTGFRR
jgi:threonine/homoserine/homoserine lactone efflux protein